MAASMTDVRTLLAECREKYAKMSHSGARWTHDGNGFIDPGKELQGYDLLPQTVDGPAYDEQAVADAGGFVTLVNAFPQLAEALEKQHQLICEARNYIDPEKHPAWEAGAFAESESCERRTEALTAEVTALRERLERRTTALERIRNMIDGSLHKSEAFTIGQIDEEARRALEDPPRRLDDGTGEE